MTLRGRSGKKKTKKKKTGIDPESECFTKIHSFCSFSIISAADVFVFSGGIWIQELLQITLLLLEPYLCSFSLFWFVFIFIVVLAEVPSVTNGRLHTSSPPCGLRFRDLCFSLLHPRTSSDVESW